MVSIEEYLAYLGRDKERIERNFATPEDVSTYIQFMNEQIVTSNITNTIERRGIGSSFALGDSNFGMLGSSGFIGSPWITFSGIGINGSTSQYMVISGGNFNFGTTDSFTIDFWFRLGIAVDATYILDKRLANAGAGFRIYMDNVGKPHFRVEDGTDATDITYPDALTANQWRHLALVRDVASDKVIGFVGGSPFVATDATTATLSNAGSLWLGIRSNITNAISGIYDEVRVSNISRWTGTFTPGSVEYVSDANTLGLWRMNTIQSGSFQDSATNNTWGSVVGATLTGGIAVSGTPISISPQPYLGDSRPAFTAVLTSNPGSPFVNNGLVQIRDFLIGSSNASIPAKMALGSGTQAWSATQSGLQFEGGVVSLQTKVSEGNQLGSFIQIIPSSAYQAGSISEMAISGSNAMFYRDTFTSVDLGKLGSEVRITSVFRIGS